MPKKPPCLKCGKERGKGLGFYNGICKACRNIADEPALVDDREDAKGAQPRKRKVRPAVPTPNSSIPPAPSRIEIIDAQNHIISICSEVQQMLLVKNRKYGNSALNPMRLFSKANPIEQLNVRIDDKLSRIVSAQDDEDEDVEKDLIGYLILKQVARRMAPKEPTT